MNVTAVPSHSAAPAQPQSADARPSLFRGLPLLCLFASAVAWLLFATVFGLIDSLKFHAPAFLAGSSHFTYGRVQPAQESALLYGFGVQAALGLGLWLLCRLGRTFLVGPLVILLGVALWNSALTVGIIGILFGSATGFDAFEMPFYCDILLSIAYLLIGVCALITFHQRRQDSLYPSQWFVLGSLFWFPWIFATAELLLLVNPSRGVLQASTAWWFAHNFDTVFLGFAGLASIFYFIPKLTGKPLHSYYLAALAFWTIALFGSWGGVPDGSPLPAWIISMGVVGAVMTLIPLLAVAINFYQTVQGRLDTLDADPTLRFSYIALTFWIIAGAQQIVGVLPHVSALVSFTWFGVARKELFHYGFFAMTVFGALYYIIPRLLPSGQAAWSPKLTAAHFWLTFLGILISYLSLVVGGIGQGILLADPNNSALQVLQGTLIPLRASTTGDLLIFVGTVAFLLNFALVLSRSCRACWTQLKEAR
jgi:cytochrome c oxidase cbb3-type subunit 1